MPQVLVDAPRSLVLSAYLAFAAFGSFWGVWGASVPRVQQQAGVSTGQLGVALLFVGAGALPAMLWAGRALDRWGLRVTAPLIGVLGAVGAGLAMTATGLVSLSIGLALVGATSGAADVAMNAVAGRAERVAARPVITRAHGVFSALVVLTSLGTGFASGAALPPAVPFSAAAAVCLAVGALLLRTLPNGVAAPSRSREAAAPAGPATRVAPFLLLGALGALAFANENAHQSWSAVFVHEEIGSSVGLSAVAPAVFAGTVAATRFLAGGLKVDHARSILMIGSLVAASGAAVLAAAPTLVVAGVGLAVAAAGTAVLFPTLIGVVSQNVDEARRGRATSVVTTVSYLGFILGPVYVGLWADAVGLRGAMVAVAALAVGLLLLTPPLFRLSGFHVRSGRLPVPAEPPATHGVAEARAFQGEGQPYSVDGVTLSALTSWERVEADDGVLLRRARVGDAAGVFAVHGDPRVYSLDPQELHTDVTVSADFLVPIAEHWDRHGFGYWTVLVPRSWWPGGTPGPDPDDGKRVNAGLGGIRHHVQDGQPVLNVYYRFAPAVQGRGLARQVLEATIQLATTAAPGIDLVVRTRPANAAARRVAERAGFVDEGVEPSAPDMQLLRRKAVV